MKLFFVLASMLLAFSANAADRKVGNIVAVEREISDIYNTCIKSLQDEDTSKPAYIFSCAFKYLNDGEMAVSKGRIVKLMDDKCTVIGDAANGTIMITFNTAKSPSSFEESRLCLERALTPKNSAKVIVYTLE